MQTTGPEAALQEALRRATQRAVGIDPGDAIPLTYPPTPAQGDLASPLCFELARTARKAPRAIAEAIAREFEPGGGIARIEVAGAGYLNAFLDRNAFLKQWLLEDRTARPSPGSPTVIVEHTNINPNKAAHIGHLRNAVLGDTLVRCLRQLGHRVEVQNYIDDTGVQVADLVVGFRVLRGEELAEVRAHYSEDVLAAKGLRFDYLAWDLYAEVGRFYEGDPARRAHRDETLHAMEAGNNPIADLARYVARRMVRHHLQTMDRIGVRYDLLPKESDILALRFWEDAFDRLKASGAIRKIDQGKNAGCWVMTLPGVEEGAGEDEKVIVRSNGTVTYVGKDIAYQMWKLGLLGRDFHYVPFDWSPDREAYPLWATTASPGRSDHPPFGHGEIVYNVIDARQSYLQRVVHLGLVSLGHVEEAERSIHFSYEMVALTPAAVAALFPDYPLDEADKAKPYLEMSGRKGLGVRADDLVEALLQRARSEVRKRNADLPEDAIEETARRISIGALRYYMVRFSRNRVVAFDLDAALAFEGETGPYLQYSLVRARNILKKVSDPIPGSDAPESILARIDLAALPEDTLADHWNLALLLSREPSVLRQAVSSLELAGVAKHAYVLAQAFNSFYHRYPVSQESSEAVRMVRIALVKLYLDGMTHLLGRMGIEVPERM